MSIKPIIGILLGDPSGVGAEIVAKTLTAGFYSDICRPIIIGDVRILNRAFNIIGRKENVQIIADVKEAKWNEGAIPFLDQNDIDTHDAQFSTVNEKCGRSCLQQISIAVDMFKEGSIDGIVFAPLNKAAMLLTGYNCESEHEYIAKLFDCNNPYGEINKVENVWTTRVTSHVPISEVSKHITIEKVLDAIKLAVQAIKKSGIENPRIGVSALNPHCGESGKCGTEEINVIGPAVIQAVKMGIKAFGPISADVLFKKAFDGEFDGIVTMYHDQGQIALKLKGFDYGVTIAGGLPAPIATCAHGTAFDIAGKGLVKTSSFEAAVKTVVDMCNS